MASSMSYPSAVNLVPHVVFVPVPAAQQSPAFKNGTKYSDMKAIPAIRTFAILSIVSGVVSIGIQIALLCFINYTYGTYDVVGHGIWAGVFYVICGGVSLGAASKKLKGLIVTSLVFASLSAASAAVASTLSGLSTSFFCTSSYVNCDALFALQWTLMGFSIYAFFNSVALVIIMCVALSNGKPKTTNQQPANNNNQQANAFLTPGGFPHGWQPNVGVVNGGYQAFAAPPAVVHATPTAPAILSSGAPSNNEQAAEQQVQPAASTGTPNGNSISGVPQPEKNTST